MSNSIEALYQIHSHEIFWINIQPFLLQRGYRLRPRYDPNWTPSWLQGKSGKKHPSPILFEDSSRDILIDATRLENGEKVVLKKVETNSQEIPFAVTFSSKEWKKDVRNCCVPILDVIMIPCDDDHALLVMPQLLGFHFLPFRFLGEFCQFTLQVLQGLEFLHEYNIVHRDICWGNILMDTSKLIPKGNHFVRWDSHTGKLFEKFEWKTRWSVMPIQYYIIDFGISLQCLSKDARGLGQWGQDRTVPEMLKNEWCNLFMVDIYQLGNVFKRCITRYQGLNAFIELADAMTKENPNERPTATESVRMCKKIIADITEAGKMAKRVWRLDQTLDGRQTSALMLSTLDRIQVRLGWNPTL
uniref:Protein kinase domain-containing protein n=1 Tax=Psilocybe cubensis TaxID=181762 RepID=A0A8H7XN86_PSICU